MVSKRRLRRLDTPPRPGVGSPIGRPSAAPIGQNFLGPVFAGAKKSVFVHEAHGRIRRTVPRDKTSQEGGFGAAVSGRWTLWAGLARSAAHKSTGIVPLRRLDRRSAAKPGSGRRVPGGNVVSRTAGNLIGADSSPGIVARPTNEISHALGK